MHGAWGNTCATNQKIFVMHTARWVLRHEGQDGLSLANASSIKTPNWSFNVAQRTNQLS